MKFLSICFYIVMLVLLTVLTQIGGLVYILALCLKPYVGKRLKRVPKKLVFPLTFLLYYMLFTIAIVPPVASVTGRVPLPVFSNSHLKPLTLLTCALNRHYVKPQLMYALEDITGKMTATYPDVVIYYLDANFPFGNGFPLFPHLSHNDGKKLDIAFFYKDSKGQPVHGETPSFVGYGGYESPRAEEYNMPEYCSKTGKWQYSLLGKLVPFKNNHLVFDEEQTRYLIVLMAKDKATEKLFLEPHLKTRLKLTSPKIRFHGCQAVRHDDHVHWQIR